MKVIGPENWIPSDNLELEDNALKAIRSIDNCLVLAGPGAGKTEMLAQKTSYLLQTNICRHPHKILAISFKKDASYNLNERIKKRCGIQLSRRFDSHTFDSFAKQILDRFKKALPDGIEVSENYDVILGNKVILDSYAEEGESINHPFEKKRVIDFHNQSLPIDFFSKSNNNRKKVWLKLISSNPSQLSFPMIMRLAELIIKTNPKIKKYLQMTYQFVFLDEFQDTTDIQYDLFKSCFITSNSVFTAVGDDKQRIMVWAGARKTIFDDFKVDSGAYEINLLMNYRSAPKIVNLLNYFSENMLGDTHKAIPSSRWNESDGECNILFFNNPEQEKQDLLTDIQNYIYQDGINPRDICILIKQQLDVYAGEIVEHLCSNSIKARNEDHFFDLLTEEITLFIINILLRCFDNSNSETRKQTFDFYINLHSESDNQKLLDTEVRLYALIKSLRAKYNFNNLTADLVKELTTDITKIINMKRLKSQYPKYKSSKELSKLLDKLDNEIWKAYEVTNSLEEALNMLLGKDTIPVMTIHKSKGLEYHTVIFVGLEDGAFWSYKNQADEDNCAFFVALSRAKERVVFTFSKTRNDKFGRTRKQSFSNIRPILDTMNDSGLVNIDNRMST